MEHEKTAKMAAEWLNHLQEEYAYNHPAGEPEAPADSKTN